MYHNTYIIYLIVIIIHYTIYFVNVLCRKNEDIRAVMFKYESYDSLHVYNFMKSAPAYVYVNERMDRVMSKFEQTEAWNLPVVTEDRTYVGFISKSKIFSSYREQLKQVSHD